jgi:DNA-binding beta-propeller fold protein YncE
LLSLFGRSGEGPGEFRAPAGLAFDREDNLYVTEIGNHRVQVFDKTGKFLTMWGRKGSAVGEFGNPHGIIVDRNTGHVYVADTSNNRVQVFEPVSAKTPGNSATSN